MLVAVTTIMLSFVGMSLSSGLWPLLVLLVPMTAGSSLFSTVSTAQLTKVRD